MINNKLLKKIDDLPLKFDEKDAQPIENGLSSWYFSLWQDRMLKFLLFNLFILVALVGVVMVFFEFLAKTLEISVFLPFNQSIGIGYPFFTTTLSSEFYHTTAARNEAFLFLIPSLVFAGLLFSGIFYVIKKMVQKQKVSFFKDFWQGFKKNFWSFALVFLAYAVFLFLVNLASTEISILVFETSNNFGYVLLQILLYSSLVLYSIMTLYMLSILNSYKTNFLSLLKNSFFLTIYLLPRNLFAFLLTAFPIIFIVLNVLFQLTFIMYVMFLAFATLLVWILYSEYVFQSRKALIEAEKIDFGKNTSSKENTNPVSKKSKKKK